MTRYKLSHDPDTGKPCMVMAPDGPWCCAGEVERIVGQLRKEIEDAAGTNDDGGVSADGRQPSKTTDETQNDAKNESVIVCE